MCSQLQLCVRSRKVPVHVLKSQNSQKHKNSVACFLTSVVSFAVSGWHKSRCFTFPVKKETGKLVL